MPRLPFPVTHPDYHNICVDWLYDVGKSLFETLQENDMPKDKIESVLGNFLFQLSMFYDEGGFYKVRGKLKPKLTFQNTVGELVVPEESTSLHEYAFGIAGQIIDEYAQ